MHSHQKLEKVPAISCAAQARSLKPVCCSWEQRERLQSCNLRKSGGQQVLKCDRKEYWKRADWYSVDPQKFLSSIIDGVKQSAFGLPYITTETKEAREYSLKVNVIGLFEHGTTNKLGEPTLTEEHKPAAIFIIEMVHLFLTAKDENGLLPELVFSQMDNCPRENYGYYVFAYFERLVALSLFYDVTASILPVGLMQRD